MRIVRDNTAAQAESSKLGATPDLSQALLHGLNLPVTALRASMEALSLQLCDRPDTSPILNGALAEVARVGRSVQDLLEYATPPDLHPLRCTIDEILCGATSGLSPAELARIDVAQDFRNAVVFVDGPLVSRNLRRLLENALEADASRVLISAKRGSDLASFSVVDDGPHDFDPDAWHAAFRTSRHGHLGLGLALVERDVRLFGGELVLARRAGRTRAQLSIQAQITEDAA